MRTLSLVLLLFAFGLVLPAWAYGPPDWNENLTEVLNLRGHGTIILKAVEILRNDGFEAMASLYSRYLSDLYKGAYQADQGGSFEYLGVTLGRNYFSHFHEASTGKGFYLTPVYSAIEEISFDWKVSTLRGPHASAADMCNLYYARAVEELRGNDIHGAMEYLGYALHVLADVTVPHHAANIGAHQDRLGETPGGKKTTHEAYENFVDRAIQEGRITHATFGGMYHLDWIPSEYVTYAAGQAAPYIGDVKYQDSGPAHFLPVANILVPLAERLSAGLLHRFFEKWKDEEFTVLVLEVDKVQALGSGLKALDSPDEADFYVKVRLGNRQFPTSGVIEGEDDVEPNVLSEYNWFYVLWVPNRTSVVPVEISLWDEDTASGDDHADIDPGGGNDLDFSLDLSKREISGDISLKSLVRKYAFTVSGKNSSDSDRARISFTLYRCPHYEPSTGPDLAAFSNPTTLSGLVRDPSGQPLGGVTVSILGTTHRVQSSTSGNYAFSDLSSLFSGSSRSLPVRVRAEKEGYVSKEFSVTLERNKGKTLEISLAPSGGEGTASPGPAVRGRLFLAGPSSSSIQGDGPISGWFWLRSGGHRAAFFFRPGGPIRGVSAAALNFSFLVTNGADGGSGFTTEPHVVILGEGGEEITSFTLRLFNPFRPRCESNTGGVGYSVFGSWESDLLRQLLSQGKSFTVLVAWPFPHGYHLAVKGDSVTLAFVVGGGGR